MLRPGTAVFSKKQPDPCPPDRRSPWRRMHAMNARDPQADLILFNGILRTQDPHNPLARAAAVSRGMITAVGDNGRIKGLAARRTRRIDLAGRLVLPGFTDVHFHYCDWALARRRLDLAAVTSLSGLIESVKTAAAAKAPGEWILGLGFNESRWVQKRMPCRDDLDAAAPHHPVLLWRCDLHLAVANSLALKKAAIDAGTRNPPRGVIERDADGRPNGILKEQAIERVKDLIPMPAESQTVRAMQEGFGEVHAMGITGLHDVRLMDGRLGALAFKSWQRLDADGKLELRCWVTLPGQRLDAAVALGLRSGWGNDRLRIGHVKYFADGGMGARTAWMLEPYRDAGCGMPMMSVEELYGRLQKAHRAGLAVAVHAIGDRTNRELAGIFERLQKGGPPPGTCRPLLPHRLEHVQMIRPPDIRRLSPLGVIACVQPHNLVLDMDMIDACLGEKGRYTYPFGDLTAAGIPVCLSSDAPVCDPRPLANIHAAVTRCRPDGTPAGGWYAKQKISVARAVRAYTRTPALAGGRSADLGCLKPGYRADMVILDRDIYRVDPMQILETRVEMTLFDGRIVHRRSSFS